MKTLKNALKISLVVTFLLLLITNLKAQGGEGLYLNGYASYVFDAGFDSYYDPGRFYDGKVNGGLLWGVGVEYRMYPETGIELLYLRQDSDAPTLWADGLEPRNTNFDVAINYILAGGSRHLPLGNGNIEGDLGLMAGAAIISATNPDTRRDDSVTKFAWSIKGGFTYWTQGRAGIRFQAQLLSPVQGMGGGLYFGTGGAGAGLSSYSTLYQFSLGGGIVLKLN